MGASPRSRGHDKSRTIQAILGVISQLSVNQSDEPRTVLAVILVGASRRGVTNEPPSAKGEGGVLAARWSPASLGTVPSGETKENFSTGLGSIVVFSKCIQ
jgi:hypothetical protein